jgi:alkylhydroperoxidase/carboxymuconolactone decarboxylase family protein YurZ
MKKTLPHGARTMADRHAPVWRAYADLGATVTQAGPLDARVRRLVKVALAMAAGLEGGTHSHAQRARDEGITAEELRHIALLAIPTLGFPAAVRGMTWIDDVLENRTGRDDADIGGIDAEP